LKGDKSQNSLDSSEDSHQPPKSKEHLLLKIQQLEKRLRLKEQENKVLKKSGSSEYHRIHQLEQKIKLKDLKIKDLKAKIEKLSKENIFVKEN